MENTCFKLEKEMSNRASPTYYLTLNALNLNFFMKTLKVKGFFFQFKIIITVLVSSFRFI